VSTPSRPDIDRILEAIRAEARSRGAKGHVGRYSDAPSAATVQVAHPGLPQPDLRDVRDFLALPLDVFVDEAYRQVLGRPGDAAGSAYYQRALLHGRITRIEVLGRLRFSPEGRARGNRVPGVGPAFLFAMLYRVPVAGPLAALAAHLLRLPAHWQDRARLEATALASGGWMKR
jgi:O-antigen chain-terminating methyltransferase